MKTASSAAATALAALHARDGGAMLERSFGHLTGDALRALDRSLLDEFHRQRRLQMKEGLRSDEYTDDRDGGEDSSSDEWAREQCHAALARACIRRKAHGCLSK